MPEPRRQPGQRLAAFVCGRSCEPVSDEKLHCAIESYVRETWAKAEFIDGFDDRGPKTDETDFRFKLTFHRIGWFLGKISGKDSGLGLTVENGLAYPLPFGGNPNDAGQVFALLPHYRLTGGANGGKG